MTIEPETSLEPRVVGRSRLGGIARRAVRAAAWFLAGNVVLAIVLLVVHLENRPDLEIWHTAELDEEFRADRGARSFDDYLALEQRLFAQLEQRVIAHVPGGERSLINRYHRGSLSDPSRWPRNWNRTFELPAEHPKAGVLLVHGMSDSPYSLRSLGERLSAEGAWVVGLRLPGHGTAPSGLVDVDWEDLAAAVEIGVARVEAKSQGAPIYIIGYSTGAPLAVHYALRAIDTPSLAAPDGLVLISPAIGVSPAAALAVWQARLGHLLRLRKLEWDSLGPEYDPFKYNSFAVNAADQVYRLASDVQSRLDTAGPERLAKMPPILAFQSLADATVSTAAVSEELFERLPSHGNQLVLFDLNRHATIEQILADDPKPLADRLLSARELPFDLTVVTNERGDSLSVVARSRSSQQPLAVDTPLGLAWPNEVFSLSHVALPMRFDDPLYGDDESVTSPGIRIGRAELRGERGLLRITPAEMFRLRWNPFFPYLEQRTLAFMRLGSTPASDVE